MEIILTYVGSIASIIGIPLAIYLYLKSREDKVDKVRLDIINTISYQIGESRELKLFEIERVIGSNLRSNKLDSGVIVAVNIIEDLISNTISSPLLNPSRKDEILKNLENIFPENSGSSPELVKQLSSRVFALTIVLLSMIPLGIVLFIGKDNWSENADFLISFGTLEGYLPNLIFSGGVGGLGLVFSLLVTSLIKKIKKKIDAKEEHNKSSKRDN
ncbi:hypothetical protein [Vibrio alginolyticus]|uniref:hypothetical protein n=1 Tax=Vibrio alginolyticus TaxID=663 RepID=UPI00186A3767|nr:hypothetical protein [Vibrio alginolyticus]MBE4422348.1 hypothetical protein [Vibrio parahaemolyticus]EHA1078957.1 hypothetical protein [Vibrio alginolyticus]EHA1137397.1 hypothetical protein [Vibrio alginolyticus]EJN8559938.1 hypothetical protein [Vibrio alginolyticus]ELB2924727.1 hypothetical protein [Vibrio alginolyticus]